MISVVHELDDTISIDALFYCLELSHFFSEVCQFVCIKPQYPSTSYPTRF